MICSGPILSIFCKILLKLLGIFFINVSMVLHAYNIIYNVIPIQFLSIFFQLLSETDSVLRKRLYLPDTSDGYFNIAPSGERFKEKGTYVTNTFKYNNVCKS